MTGALLYLRAMSARNFIVHRLGRLRQPRYLIGTAAALGYLYLILGRRAGAGAAFAANTGVASGFGAILCTVMCALAMVRLAYTFISPAEKPGLNFSEAEIAFLFPAPVSRRALIHFRLISAQLAILFSSVLLSLLFRRSGPGAIRFLAPVGWWAMLSSFGLALTGINLTLAKRREGGASDLGLRIAALAGIALYALAVVLSVSAFVRNSGYDPLAAPGGWAGFVEGLGRSFPLRWLILPFKVICGPYLAAGPLAFAKALAPALVVVAVGYAWVSASEARFEEGSIALAERRSALRAAFQRGQPLRPPGKPGRSLREPFPLSGHGLPEVAFLWKNLLSMRSSLLNRRVLFICAAAMASITFAFRTAARDSHAEAAGIAATAAAVVAGYTVVLGPQIARQDLRSDMQNLDILKTFPLEGWRLALGEMLAPVSVLSAVIWAAIGVFALSFDPHGSLEWLTPAVRIGASLCIGAVVPFVALIELVVPNLILVIFPGWGQATRSAAPGSGGIEMMGQRMVMALAQLLLALFVVIPVSVAAALIVFSSQWLIGPVAAMALAALVCACVLCGEAAVGLWLVGSRFEKLDLSSEVR